ncbi:MAG: hypothetical protein ACYDCQ_08590 [Dehalococcoidia bacterium]
MVYDDSLHTRFQGSPGSRGKTGPVGSTRKKGPGSRGGKPRVPGKAGGRKTGPGSRGGKPKPPPKGRGHATSHPKKTTPHGSSPHPTSHTRKSGAQQVPNTDQLASALAGPQLLGRHKGAGLGHTGALHGQQLGHHPQASGKLDAVSARHLGMKRRARIISYNSTTNTATVQYGDTPDSPLVNIPVSAAITAAEMGSASMAGIDLWDDTDPTDAMIAVVL